MMDRRRTETDWREQSVYVTILLEQVEIRKREHGEGYLTPNEEQWLQAHGLTLIDHDVIIRKHGPKPATRRPEPARA